MTKISSYKLHKNDRVGVVVEYNTTLKKYSNGVCKLRYNSYSNIKGMPFNNKKNGSSTEEQLERYRNKRLYQRKEKIQDLAFNYSKWEYFVTLTFDNEFMDNGYSHDKAVYLLTKWLDNQKHQNRDMVYLLVPELHKSGRLHFHGLFANVEKWKLSPAINPKTSRAIYKNGCQIFNLLNYKIGFTTVSKIKSIDKVSFYISKYMTKELLNLRNKKNIWHSKNLLYPEKIYYKAENFDEIYDFLEEKDIEYNNTSFKELTDTEVNIKIRSQSYSYYAKYLLPIIDKK